MKSGVIFSRVSARNGFVIAAKGPSFGAPRTIWNEWVGHDTMGGGKEVGEIGEFG